MEMKIVSLPQIAIIGKQGLCTKDKNVAQALWKEANTHFEEIASLGMKEKDASYVGFWGAMSDETMAYLPWSDHYTCGYYLAGLEVYIDTKAPIGWTKWILPARTYLKVLLDPKHYMETFQAVIHQTIPKLNMRLCGAVCEFIDPSTQTNYLLFPIDK